MVDFPHIYNYLVPMPLPPVNDNDRAMAKASPGDWLYYTDPSVPVEQMTRELVIGGRKADEYGNVSDEFWVNPDYIPHPNTIRGEVFANPLELVLWRMMNGHNDVGTFIHALSQADLIIVRSPDDPDGRNGWPLLPPWNGLGESLRVYTSPKRLPPDTNPWLQHTVSGRDVLEQVCPRDKVSVTFNPPHELGVTLAGALLAFCWDEWTTAHPESHTEQQPSQRSTPLPHER